MAVPAEGHLPRPHQHLRSSPSSPSAIGTAIILPADQYKYVTAFIGFPLILSWNWAALLCPCNSSPVNGLFMSFAHFSTASLWRIDMKEFLIIGSLLLVWGALFLSQVLVLCLLQTFLETFQHWQHSLQKSLAPESVETGTNPEKGTNVTALGGFGAQTPICYFLCKKKKILSVPADKMLEITMRVAARWPAQPQGISDSNRYEVQLSALQKQGSFSL